MEASLSIGVLSIGLLGITPLLMFGMQAARFAHIDRDSSEVAQTLIEEAKQGTPPPAITYFDFEGNPSDPATAAYTTRSTLAPSAENAKVNLLTLCITPRGAPERARTYAALIPAP